MSQMKTDCCPFCPELQRRIDILEAPERERLRKQGAYWLTLEGRSEVREIWDEEIAKDIAPVYLNQIEQLERELAALCKWKAEALEIEAMWDVQAVAKVLDLPPGTCIQSAILPGIQALRTRLERAESGLRQIDKNDEGIAAAIARETLAQITK